ncbi:hypothetical protein ElyMa_000971500 [Elysia marginata]|uniref:Uncharacterized protein n=1 Tax=Elysia marginata TaxID=1093978 RepID=A0AAV4HI99_9GAST|nr:hypothetical protein ElyMa_000971500 [Elysia marginata]
MQSSVALKTNGAHQSPDRLRLHIVEMAEKRSRKGSGNKGDGKAFTNMPTNSREGNVESSKLEDLRKDDREINGELFRPTAIARVGQSRERITLDLPKTPKQRQDQQSLSPYQRVVVLDAGTHNNNSNNSNGISNKDRASARLLRRFRQRRFLNDDAKPENCYVNDGLQDKILPSQYKVFTVAEPTKRFRAPSGTMIEKPTSTQVIHPLGSKSNSKTPEDERDTASLTPTTHFPSNDSADAKKQQRIEAKEFTNERRYGQPNTARNKQDNLASTREEQGSSGRLSELKGNALATPPPRQNSAKKPGVFSASLEAFRRRLRLTANKYSDRLNNENVDRTEEYVIRPGPQAKTGALNPQPSLKARHGGLQFPRFGPQRNVSQQIRPVSETRQTDPKLGQSYLCSKEDDHKEVYTLIENQTKTDKSHNKNSVKENIDINNNVSSNNIDREYKVKNDGENSHNICNRQNFHNKETTRKNSVFTIVSSKNGLIKSVPQKALVIKELSTVDTDDEVSDTLPCTKQPVPKVKTYVVMDTLKGAAAGNQLSSKAVPQPPLRRVAPLTEHNMRLHESLLAMYERRAQRMARYQKRQKALQLQQEKEKEQQQLQSPGQRDKNQQQTEVQEQTPMRQERQQIQQQPPQRQLGKDNVGDHDSDNSEEDPNSIRIRKWVMDVAEQFIFPAQTESIDTPRNYLAQSDLAVESAIQFENPLQNQGAVCC